MTDDMQMGILWGLGSAFVFFLVFGFILKYQEEWREFQSFRNRKPIKPEVVNAHFVDRPSSQALAKRSDSLPVPRPKQITRRLYGE